MPRRLIRMAMTMSAALALASCATMSPEQCRFANWNDVGLNDGLAGQPLALLATRASDCAESGVRIDSAAYHQGRNAGLQSFCRPASAVQLGLNGGSYAGVCPPHIDGEFRRRYQAGYNVYATRAEMARLDQRVESLEQRLRRLDRDEDRRLREADKEDDRRRIRREIDDERRNIRDELRHLDHQLRRARDYARDAEWALSQLR
jgi:hypothetical protein